MPGVGRVVMLLALAGCSHAAPPATKAPAHPGPSPTAGGSGRVGDPRIESCQAGHVAREASLGTDDFAVGPLRYASAAAWAARSPTSGTRNPDGTYFYKTGAYVTPGRTATITIAPAARSFASIVTEYGPDQGSLSVTYSGCAHTPVWWVGGFRLTRPRACLPLDVTVAGDPAPLHTVLSLFNGRCAGSAG